MKFKEALKHIPIGGTAADGMLERTERIFPCRCGTRTGWRLWLAKDIPPTPCCSDECLDRHLEADQESNEPALSRISTGEESVSNTNEREKDPKGTDH